MPHRGGVLQQIHHLELQHVSQRVTHLPLLLRIINSGQITTVARLRQTFQLGVVINAAFRLLNQLVRSVGGDNFDIDFTAQLLTRIIQQHRQRIGALPLTTTHQPETAAGLLFFNQGRQNVVVQQTIDFGITEPLGVVRGDGFEHIGTNRFGRLLAQRFGQVG